VGFEPVTKQVPSVFVASVVVIGACGQGKGPNPLLVYDDAGGKIMTPDGEAARPDVAKRSRDEWI
jgi:hypothetical protein